MARSILFFSLLMCFANSVFAQTPADSTTSNPWRMAGTVSLSTMQSAYSDNWGNSEEGNVAWLSSIDFSARKQMTPLLRWRNTVLLEYGQQQNQDNETKKYSQPAETSDRIDLMSTLLITRHTFLDPFISGRFESSFTDNRNGENLWLNPMMFTESAGISKTIWDEEKRDWFASLGFSMRQSIDSNYPLDTDGNFGDHNIYDGGLQLQSEMTTPVAKDRIQFATKLTLYQALMNSESDELEGEVNADYWRALDVDWETSMTANITKLVMVNLKLRLLYDKEVDLGGRFRQALSAGLTYSFI